jgi:hypothetical protein
MTPEQASALIDFATDFSRGNADIVASVKAAIASPPRTTEEVGYYLSGKENDFENCFRRAVALLEPYTMSAEDKYVYEIFSLWVGEDCLLKVAPPELVAAFPEFLSSSEEEAEEAPPDSARAAERAAARIRSGYAAGVRALESAFDAAGFPLLSLDLGGGDTLVFVNVERRIADRWRGKVLGHTHEGTELGVRSPMWQAFWHHLDYALGSDLGPPPPEL